MTGPAAGPDTFSALDSANAAPSATWIHAGARQAEAGYLDPALGWVSVRAESSAGALHAAILPGSAEAAQALGNHLAGINNYVAEHHGESAYVTMAAPARGDSAFQPAGYDSGAHQQRQHETNEGQTAMGSAPGDPVSRGTQSLPQASWESPSIAVRSGAHISVVA